jgi:hypothetical protein
MVEYDYGLLGWSKAMNEMFLTLFVMLLFLLGVTTRS